MIRHALFEELDEIMKVYDTARQFMRKTGNPTQWGDGYPQREVLEEDIKRKQLYVLCDGEKVRAAFAFLCGPDPTYLKIYDGAWQSDEPYFAIHRVASDGTQKGFFGKCVEFCLKTSNHLRIDTHADNVVMQHVVEKQGFKRAGIIHLANGDPRIAYELIKAEEK